MALKKFQKFFRQIFVIHFFKTSAVAHAHFINNLSFCLIHLVTPQHAQRTAQIWHKIVWMGSNFYVLLAQHPATSVKIIFCADQFLSCKKSLIFSFYTKHHIKVLSVVIWISTIFYKRSVGVGVFPFSKFRQILSGLVVVWIHYYLFRKQLEFWLKKTKIDLFYISLNV